MGLAGMAFALLGADVVLTDTTDPVLSLLKRNADANITPIALKLKDAAWAVGVAGHVSVAELDWANPEHYPPLNPPFDYVIAADCVYNELAVPHFLNAVLAMTGPRTSVAICNEFRSQSVHDVFMQEFSKHFTVKKVPMNKMAAEYQHPLIHIYLLKRKKEKSGGTGIQEEHDDGEVGDDLVTEGGRDSGCDGEAIARVDAAAVAWTGAGENEIEKKEHSEEELAGKLAGVNLNSSAAAAAAAAALEPMPPSSLYIS